jgi:hypothetical protein
MCLARDPSFHWPTPQESYLSLELSGRRTASPRSFIPPRTLVARADDAETLFRKISSLTVIFRRDARKDEILSDFMDRLDMRDYFSEGPGSSGRENPGRGVSRP